VSEPAGRLAGGVAWRATRGLPSGVTFADRPAPPADSPPPPPVGPPAARPSPAADAGSPFLRAQRFLEQVAALTPADWREVLRRVQTVDAAARRAAVHRLGELLVGHPQTRAFDALTRLAHEALHGEGGGGARKKAVPNDLVPYVTGVIAHAAHAVALRERLTAREFDALAAPFARAVPALGEGTPPG